MRCVKETLPPRERARWLLITTRLSMSSLAGTARTLVAVGTWSEDSMLVTTRAAGPRSGVTWACSATSTPLTAGTSRGVGLASGAVSWAAGAGLAAGAAAGVAGAGFAAGAALAAGAAGAGFAAAFSAGAGVAPLVCADDADEVPFVPPVAGSCGE